MWDEKKGQSPKHLPIPLVLIAVLVLTVLALGFGISLSPKVLLALNFFILVACCLAFAAWLIFS
jgi:hypothetical protein